MIKKFLTVLGLGLAVFAVSCGDDDPTTITIGTITDLVVSDVKTTGDNDGSTSEKACSATVTSSGSTAAQVVTQLETIKTETDIVKIFGDVSYTSGSSFKSVSATSTTGTNPVVFTLVETDGNTTSETTGNIFFSVTCKGSNS